MQEKKYKKQGALRWAKSLRHGNVHQVAIYGQTDVEKRMAVLTMGWMVG